ncbi:MAG: DNA-directed RNA polymerase subunit B'', partial [Thermosphaera sp.]
MSGQLTVDDLWLVMKKYFEEKGLVRQHLDSYDRFIRELLPEMLNEFKEVRITEDVKITIVDYSIGEPQWITLEGIAEKKTPMECRLRNLTYAAPVMVKIRYVDETGRSREQELKLMDLPVMLKSSIDPLRKMSAQELINIGEDPKDPGGYFIINGSEKVLVAQEDLASNNIITDVAPEGSSYTHLAKIISVSKGKRSQLVIERRKDGLLYANFQGHKIPVVILMAALGLASEVEMLNAVSLNPEIQVHLLPSITEAQKIFPKLEVPEGLPPEDVEKVESKYREKVIEEALDFIGSRIAIGKPREERVRRALRALDENLLPHIGTDSSQETRLKKAVFIGQMISRIIELHLGYREPDDKDHYRNKRLKLAGDLLSVLLRNALNAFTQDLKESAEKYLAKNRRLDLKMVIKPSVITDRILHSMATGNWPGGKTGVSQLLDRTNMLSTLSHLRRVVSPLSRGQPHFEARELHGTQWGRMCPFETPEGANIGLVKNLSLMVNVSIGVPDAEIESILYKHQVKPLITITDRSTGKPLKGILDEVKEAVKQGVDLSSEYEGWSRVYLNGRLIGYHPNGEELVKELRKMRRQGKLSSEVNVAHIRTEYLDEVYVNTDPGRIRRPLLVVEKGEVKLSRTHIEKLKQGEMSFEDLVNKGIIEYLDPDEEENAYIALSVNEVTQE